MLECNGSEDGGLSFVTVLECHDLRSLVSFEKLHPGRCQGRTVQLTIAPRQLSLVVTDGSRSIQPGEYELYVDGGQSSSETGVVLPLRIEVSDALAP